VPLPELNPGQVMPEHLGLEFAGENEWIPVGTSAWFWDVGTRKSQIEDLACSGSRDEWLGVPVIPVHRLVHHQ